MTRNTLILTKSLNNTKPKNSSMANPKPIHSLSKPISPLPYHPPSPPNPRPTASSPPYLNPQMSPYFHHSHSQFLVPILSDLPFFLRATITPVIMTKRMTKMKKKKMSSCDDECVSSPNSRPAKFYSSEEKGEKANDIGYKVIVGLHCLHGTCNCSYPSSICKLLTYIFQ